MPVVPPRPVVVEWERRVALACRRYLGARVLGVVVRHGARQLGVDKFAQRQQDVFEDAFGQFGDVDELPLLLRVDDMLRAEPKWSI